MSLQNIQLPLSVIQNLYKNSLVDLEEDKQKIITDRKSDLYFIGNNLKQIIFIVNHNADENLSERQLNFLTSILSACGLTINDIALINISKQPEINYQKISELFNARIIIMHDVLPEILGLPFTIPLFQVQSFNMQTYLPVPSLDELETDKEQKRKFWASLKKIFSL